MTAAVVAPMTTWVSVADTPDAAKLVDPEYWAVMGCEAMEV